MLPAFFKITDFCSLSSIYLGPIYGNSISLHFNLLLLLDSNDGINNTHLIKKERQKLGNKTQPSYH